MVLTAYMVLLVVVLMVRPIALSVMLSHATDRAACQFGLLFSALYFLPVLTVIHAVLAGILCEYLLLIHF